VQLNQPLDLAQYYRAFVSCPVISCTAVRGADLRPHVAIVHVTCALGLGAQARWRCGFEVLTVRHRSRWCVLTGEIFPARDVMLQFWRDDAAAAAVRAATTGAVR